MLKTSGFVPTGAADTVVFQSPPMQTRYSLNLIKVFSMNWKKHLLLSFGPYTEPTKSFVPEQEPAIKITFSSWSRIVSVKTKSSSFLTRTATPLRFCVEL